MKIIDILNKIANNEEPPKKILYEGIEYEWWESEYCKDYHNDIEGYLIDSHIITDILNDEVEIIEDKPSEEIRKLQSEIDILTNKVEHYYSEVVSFRDKTRYLKDELKKLKENK